MTRTKRQQHAILRRIEQDLERIVELNNEIYDPEDRVHLLFVVASCCGDENHDHCYNNGYSAGMPEGVEEALKTMCTEDNITASIVKRIAIYLQTKEN